MKKTVILNGALLLLALLSGCGNDDVGDITPPVLTVITPVADIVNNPSPVFVFQSSEGGLLSFSGDCHSEQKNAFAGINTLTFSSLFDGVYDNCVIHVTDLKGNLSLALPVNRFVVDTVAPVLAEVTPVLAITNDTTPSYSFRSSEAGFVSYSGACSSVTKNSMAGINTITINDLVEGVYNNCQISVIDDAGNSSLPLMINGFVIDAGAVILSTVSAIPSVINTTTPELIFSSNKAGTILYSGACSSSVTTALAGDNTITLDPLVQGTYSDCKIAVKDMLNKTSAYLPISPFTVVTISPASLFGSRPNIIVIVTDDQGYADLGVQGFNSDIKTPNIDGLAQEGIRMTSGYITAPQCAPSRVALVTGQYQQRFDFDDNLSVPLTLNVETIAQRMQLLGYKTGLIGKWHLEISNNDSLQWFSLNHPELSSITEVTKAERLQYYPQHRGFDWVYTGLINNFLATFLINGTQILEKIVNDSSYRVDLITNLTTTFIEKNYATPFYLSVNYYAPHVPLEATAEYLDSIPLFLNAKRRYALAMMMAIDKGVGTIVAKLKEKNIYENTLIFYMSDNGAPIAPAGSDPDDLTVEGSSSFNTPLRGGKNSLFEGGIRVPFLMHWKGTFPENMRIDKPVSSLDIGTTALYLAGDSNYQNLDGLNLMEYLFNPSLSDERTLFWKFRTQMAVRTGNWKYLYMPNGGGEYLFNLGTDMEERKNQINLYPGKADELRAALELWKSGL